MLAKFRRSLTYANVMSTLAVCLALAGGTAYAANTIGSADVINYSLRGEDIASGTLTDRNLADRSVGVFELKREEVLSRHINDGSVRSSDLRREVVTKSVEVGPRGAGFVETPCPPGKKPLGGGFAQGAYGLFVTDSRPAAHDSGWAVNAINREPYATTLTAWVICT